MKIRISTVNLEDMPVHKNMTARRVISYLLTVATVASFALCCASTKETVSDTVEAHFQKAKRRCDASRYLEASEQFKTLLARFPGSKYAEPATFFLGQCYYQMKEYPLAEIEFERIIKDFPRGSYAEEAVFMLAMCFYKQRRPTPYDQSATEKAIDLLRAYMSAHPKGTFMDQARLRLRECRSQLAEKLYSNGVLYLKLDDSRAARLSFEEVLEKYGDLHWADWALVGIARSYEEERNWRKAAETYESVVERDGDAEALKLARDRLKKVQEKTNQTSNTG